MSDPTRRVEMACTCTGSEARHADHCGPYAGEIIDPSDARPIRRIWGLGTASYATRNLGSGSLPRSTWTRLRRPRTTTYPISLSALVPKATANSTCRNAAEPKSLRRDGVCFHSAPAGTSTSAV